MAPNGRPRIPCSALLPLFRLEQNKLAERSCCTIAFFHLCQVVRHVCLVVGEPANRVVAEVGVLESQAAEPFQRGEFKQLLEAAQSIVRKINIAQCRAEGKTVAYLGETVAAQPELFEGCKTG